MLLITMFDQVIVDLRLHSARGLTYDHVRTYAWSGGLGT